MGDSNRPDSNRGLSMTIEWVPVTPGRAIVGSDNRSILFGGVGPKHMIEINYSFSISKNPVAIADAEKLIEDKEAQLCSESEWELAYQKGLIYGGQELEKLSDRCNGNYWGKSLDGRPYWVDDWSFRITKQWSSGKPETKLIARDSEESKFARLVRYQDDQYYNQNPKTLPKTRDIVVLLKEEFLIAFFIGIIPSFVWAYFNASPGYIRSGWPGLVFGGIILGLFSMIFWRPRTTSFRLGRNCGKVKENRKKLL
jgi:hypothetical protein